MKKLILLLFVVITNFSCSKDDVEPTFEITGKIIDSDTNLGVPNIELEITTKRGGMGYIFGGVIIDIDKITIKTNQDGNFTTKLPLKDATIFSILKFDDGNYTGINKSFYLKDSQNINISIERFEILKIFVKNVTPHNLNDRIEFNSPSSFLVSRVNYGNLNEPQTFNQGVGSAENVWLGTNVNSEIIYKVPKSYENNMGISVKKNGIWSTIPKTPINIISNQINEYYINY
jgi:hypothetical protein